MNNTNSKVLSTADLYALKKNNVILARNGANCEIFAIDRIVQLNYRTSFLLCPLIPNYPMGTGFSRDVVYDDDISWWSLDEMAQWADSWERVYQ